MKITAKVFILIGMILGCVLIFPIIVGCFALSKLNNAQKSDDVKSMGVLTLLFCSLLGGVFMLCLKDEDLQENIKDIRPNNISTENKIMKNEENYEIVKPNEISNFVNNIKICTFIQIPIVIIILILTIVANYKFYSAYVPVIVSFIMVIVFIVNICLYFTKNQDYNNVNQVLDILLTFVSIAVVIASLVVNYEYAYEIFDKSRYSYYTGQYEYYSVIEYCEGASWELWISAILGLVLLIVSIIKTNLYNKEIYNVISLLELLK